MVTAGRRTAFDVPVPMGVIAMKRRAFVAGLSGAVLLSSLTPRAGRAQARTLRVGMILPSLSDYPLGAEPFLHGMRDLGWDPGRNCVIDVHGYGTDVSKVPTLAS